ncbi:tetraacyldisaccharide 4'-kinase [Dyella jiangningensis]|uniref:Tetraacyldisaccharide 4'-kinase n=1 Tax=Dyella jiangningensis TaxID=1379159 RepID=A0A328P183_9GAMM|nr:tetraacyldisaccharide 4'-kinase [Dyella jiangningensis]RAO75103.1 tetraacyldisaccharide 4'-kinase [Dyella jiangningensis]
MTLAERLESAWYGVGRTPWWTAPLALLYGVLTGLRRALYRMGVLRSVRLPVPVVVIGNLTAGGTGKTPLTIAIAESLRRRGYRPGVVSRGYGGSQREPVLLGESPDPAVVGDEPCLIRASGVAVAVGRERPAAAKLLIEAGCDVVIADDGLQHYALARDVEICVIDGVRRFGNGRLLPAGPLREPLSRLARVDFRICNGGAVAPGDVPMQLQGGQVRSLVDGQHRPLADFAGQDVHAVAAIGHPQRFFASLRSQGLQVIEHPFPDHHAFARDELSFGDDKPVLMTEKDAVKCQAFAQPHWWTVPVRAVLPQAFFDELDDRIRKVPARRGGAH